MSVPRRWPALLTRPEVRLALAAGLSTGFSTMTGIPFGYYAPLSVLAAMGTNYGSTFELGRQRVLGTLLGAVVLVISFEGLRDVPSPLGIAIALGAQRLLGGLLRLEVGYKVGGLVIVMGWLAHNDQFGQWIPLRLFWSVFGILVSLLSMQLLWPSSAVLNGWRQWGALLDQLAQAMAQLNAGSALHPRASQQQVARLRTQLVALRAALPAVQRELGGGGAGHPVLSLIGCLDESCSRLIGLLGGLHRSQPQQRAAAFEPLRAAEVAVFAAVADRLQLWSAAMTKRPGSRSHALPPPPEPGFEPPEPWWQLEAQLDDPRLSRMPLEHLEQIALRQQLCRQVIAALQRTEHAWQRTCR